MAGEQFSTDLSKNGIHHSDVDLNCSALGSQRADFGRELHLEQIIARQCPPIVVLCGQSSSGKSTILQPFKDLGYEPAVRLMPRQVRAGDSVNDRPWSKTARGEAGEHSQTFDTSEILFSHFLYSGYYAFPSSEILRQNKSGHGSVCIIGRCAEIPSLIEAVRNHLPLVPVVAIKLEVPLSILESRLRKRPEAFPGEVDERLAALKKHQQDDAPHIPSLCHSYGLRQILNVDASELTACGYSLGQMQPSTPDLVRNLVGEMISEAQERSIALAKDVIKPRSIAYNHPYIPNALIDVLENQLVPHAEKFSVPVCIKGGLAVAIYLENSRPVSLDIDFTAPESMSPESRMGEMLKALHGYEVECKDAWNKKVYHVRGYSSKAFSDVYKEDCELDSLAITRVQPGNENFCFEFHFDSHDFFHRRTVTLPNGKEAFLVPPEQVVIEKLAAGRGPELGKFDLFDVAGILSYIPMDPALIHKMLDGHLFDPKIDFDVANKLQDLLPLSFKGAMQALDLKASWLKLPEEFLAQELADWNLPKGGDLRISSIHALKKLALCIHLDRALAEVEKQFDHPWNIGTKHVTIREYFEPNTLAVAISRLRAQIQSFANFEVGRSDIFVRRSFTSSQERDFFFASLPQQQERLSATY